MNEINICEPFRATVSALSLLKPKGKFVISSIENKNLLDDRMSVFYVDNDQFHFHYGIHDEGVFLQRNNYQCTLKQSEIGDEIVHTLMITWDTFYIRIIAFASTKIIEKITETPSTSPPIELKKWARKQQLIPTSEFSNMNDFHQAITNCLQSLKDTIQSGGYETFYDIQYKGKKIESKFPKREPNVQPIIESLIETELTLKGIDVIRENVTEIGKVDFTLIGYVKDYGIAKYCVELKNAHSESIEHGLTNQLPAYIDSLSATGGTYIVLHYGSDLTNGISKPVLGDRLYALKKNSVNSNVSNINIIVIDLEKKKTASKK